MTDPKTGGLSIEDMVDGMARLLRTSARMYMCLTRATLDTFGLCDRHIAHHGTGRSRMGKTDWPYVFAARPTFYYYNFGSGVRDMYKHSAFRDQRDDYWLVTTPLYRRVPYRAKKMLLVRKDWPHLDALAAAMEVTYVEPIKELRRLRVW